MNILNLYYPVESTTGNWSYPSLFMISMVCSTVRVGVMVRGALSSREDTFSSHHLKRNIRERLEPL